MNRVQNGNGLLKWTFSVDFQSVPESNQSIRRVLLDIKNFRFPEERMFLIAQSTWRKNGKKW